MKSCRVDMFGMSSQVVVCRGGGGDACARDEKKIGVSSKQCVACILVSPGKDKGGPIHLFLRSFYILCSRNKKPQQHEPNNSPTTRTMHVPLAKAFTPSAPSASKKAALGL